MKLLCIALFALHFQASKRAWQVFGAYAASNLALLLCSYFLFFFPNASDLLGVKEPGVPVKNYIDQSQGFALIAVVAIGLAAELVRTGQRMRALPLCATSAAFLANLAFVNVARTAFIYVPVMLAFLALRYVRGVRLLGSAALTAAVMAGLIAVSPNLQTKTGRVLNEIDSYRLNAMFTANGYPAGGAERLEFWRKSISFVRSAPFLGHGTGSTKSLFAAAAIGQVGLTGRIVDNPHNQILAVAIQWGAVGCLILFGMWGTHLWLFRAGVGVKGGFLAWIGFVAVVQNIASSIFNSHLFDFYQGWLYVLVVGIIGGRLQSQKTAVTVGFPTSLELTVKDKPLGAGS